MQDDARKPSKAIIAIIVVVLLAVAAAGSYYLMNNKQTTTSQSTTPSSTEATGAAKPNATDATNGDYKDGTYSATGEYISPGGQESIDVKVTLTDKKITDIIVTPHPASGTSVQYQTEFADNFKPMVVGKSIDEVKLSRVAGSSLTSGGFNDAISQIKADAAA